MEACSMLKQDPIFKGGSLERILAKLEGFRVFAENSALGMAVTDLRGRLKFVNSALANLLGYSIEEMVNRPFKDFLHPTDKWRIVPLLRRIIGLKRQPRYLEFRVVRKDGSILYLWSKPSRFIVGGKTVGFQAILVDITRLKETERKLAEANRKLEMILEAAMEGIWVVDPYLNLKFVNKAFAEIVGYGKNELLGLNLQKFVDKEGFRKFRRAIETRKKGKMSRYELVLYRKDGEPRFVQISGSPLFNENGKFAGAIAIVMDITEQKIMERRIRESEERLKKLLEYAPDAIYINDLNGNFIDGNRQAEILTGYRREEFIGKNMLEIGLLPEKYLQKAAEALQKNMRGEKTGPDEFELIKKDGTSIFVEISTFPVTKGDSVEVIGIARDITERKYMQKKLEEYSQQLEKLVEERTKQLKEAQEQLLKSERLAAIGQVAAMVGHDLRNPLASISGAAYYLKRKFVKKLDEKAKKMLEIIEREIQYSNKIINDLVEYSREIKLELTETTPKAIVRDGLALVEIPRNVEVLNLTQDKPKIKVDVDKMRRVFANFIKNAVDAMPDGGKLTILSKKSDGNVQFMFVDTGVGMAKELMEKIWTPFFTTKAKGMGLGLPICKRIIEAHGGKVSVESTVGEGTTFTVTIPIEPKPKEEGGENKIWVKLPESSLSTTTKA
jgi:PAS domain S-box-containing protein